MHFSPPLKKGHPRIAGIHVISSSSLSQMSMVKFQIKRDVYRNFTIGAQWDSLMLYDILMGIRFNPNMHWKLLLKTLTTESALRAYGWKNCF